MPVARTDTRRAILVGIAGVVFAVGIVAVVLAAAGSTNGGSADSSLDVLEVETLLRFQDRDGVPTCIPDPATGLRPICVFHTGERAAEGWVAYDAQVDGCAFEPLSPGATELVDSCTSDTYPFTGEGLPQYPVEVRNGRLDIDLGGTADDDASTTATTSTPESTGDSTSTSTGG